MSTVDQAPPVAPYIQDIHLQPQSLARLLDAGLPRDVRKLLKSAGQFDRVVMTGMGSSLFALHPTFLRLAEAGLPVWNIETSELLGGARSLITANTLLWVTSQSGQTPEVLALLDSLPVTPEVVFGVTNDASSPMASSCHHVLELHSGDEKTVSTRSYLNTLAASALAVGAILDQPEDQELAGAPDKLSEWLQDWPAHLAHIDSLLPPATTFILGRGASLAATRTGSLIIKEASGTPVEGMSVAAFRHGPLEMAGPDLSVLLLAGAPSEHRLNEDMRDDLTHHGARVAWIDTSSGQDGIRMPDLRGDIARPIAEFLPFEALSVVLAHRRGREPGSFTKIGKVSSRL